MSVNGPSIETRIYAVERDTARHELDLVDHEKRIGNVERVSAVLAAKVGVYASLGAFAGGTVVALAAKFLN